ncbi:hypothetical protein ACHAWO_005137 [Cyclotella atomus]|uniref:Uncharacterized protein n=1 Tax=Cyclotella atomus TaxID=382360 RepID=A0ABD3N4Y8_9STRA
MEKIHTLQSRRVRNAIQDEDFISRYVKRSIPKSEEVPNLIYEAIQPNEIFFSSSVRSSF